MYVSISYLFVSCIFALKCVLTFGQLSLLPTPGPAGVAAVGEQDEQYGPQTDGRRQQEQLDGNTRRVVVCEQNRGNG